MSSIRITRMPDDKLPVGRSRGFVESVQVVPQTSQKGKNYEAIQLDLQVLFEEYGMTAKNVVNIPIFWNSDGTLVRTLRAFDILPEIGEDADIGKLARKIVEVTVEEKMKDGKPVRNVVSVAPSLRKPHPLLKELLDRHNEAYRQAETHFEDDDDAEEEEPDGKNDVGDEGEAEDYSANAHVEAPKQSPRSPVKRKFLGNRAAAAKPSRNDEDEDLGDL